MKNIYKTLFIYALVLIGLLIFVAWYFWTDRNFYIKLIKRENVNIERECKIIDVFVENLKKLFTAQYNQKFFSPHLEGWNSFPKIFSNQ